MPSYSKYSLRLRTVFQGVVCLFLYKQDFVKNADSSTGTFTVSGTGSLYDFLDADSPYENYYAKKIVIENGITKITAFSLWLGEYSEIHIPRSVTTIEDFAFSLADDNTHIYYAGTEAEWKKMDRGYDFYFDDAIMHYGTTGTSSQGTSSQTTSGISASASASSSLSSSAIKVYIDGKLVSFDVQPQLIGGRTMVPLRAIFEGLGATVEWNGNTQTITAYNETTIVRSTIGEYTMNVNETAKSIDVPPMLVNDRTLVPARFVAEAFDCDVQWDGNTKTVSITTKEIDYSKVEQSTTQKPSDSKNSAMRVRTIKGSIQGWIDPKKYEIDLYLSTQVGNDIYYISAEAGRALVYVFNILSGDTELYCDFSDCQFELYGQQGDDWEIVNCIYSIFYDQSQKAVCVYASADHNDVLTGRVVERDVIF